ncbi:MAG: hypothetical protein DRJ03_01780 [Chloroflexi bacterium]|nr:MAG: hypothetical protein DRJ03_01780 [Chloroflexota bacterium]
MIVERPNPSQVVLQAVTKNLDGTPKTSLTLAAARVYHVNAAGADVEDLGSTSLAQVGTSSTWRYRWTPAALPVGHYFVEYALVDSDGVSFVDVEDMVVQDFALQADVALIKAVESGKWEISNNQMVFYDTSGAEILRFNLFDINGDPTNGINMYKREPV